MDTKKSLFEVRLDQVKARLTALDQAVSAELRAVDIKYAEQIRELTRIVAECKDLVREQKPVAAKLRILKAGD